MIKPFALLLTALIVGPLSSVYAQSAPSPHALFQTIQALDPKLFDAYNRCELEKFGSMPVDDLEFYHDLGGLMRTGQATVDAVKKNICGKVRRELVPGTLEVYPIANYGAVEIGVHRFLHQGQAKTEPDGQAKFIHLWQNKEGVWKLARIISFDHHAVAK